jgi:hypothetical protein
MVDFKALMKNKKKSLSQLTEEAKKTTGGGSYEADLRYWKPTRDKAGNGFAIVRFLPAGVNDPEDALPWVKYWEHAFKGPTGKWYIDLSRTSLGNNEPDPVSDANSNLWDTGLEDNKKIARERKRKLKYVSNILVLKDSANPENEGKVFLYAYGAKIFGKLQEAMEPSFEGEKAINPFDMWEGANFKLKIKTINSDGAKMPNYDDSSFDNQSPISDDDEEIEKIFNQTHSITEIVAPDKFKPYDELKKRLIQVWPAGVEGVAQGPAPKATAEAPAQKSKAAPVDDDVPWADDDDDDTGFFANLADDDD